MKITRANILHVDISLEELSSLYHICTYVSHEESCGTLREEARHLAHQLESFDINKMGSQHG